MGSFVAKLLVIVVEKFASSFSAAASSFSVSNVEGAESIKFEIAVCTKAVVATFVELSVVPRVILVKFVKFKEKVWSILITFEVLIDIPFPCAYVVPVSFATSHLEFVVLYFNICPLLTPVVSTSAKSLILDNDVRYPFIEWSPQP